MFFPDQCFDVMIASGTKRKARVEEDTQDIVPLLDKYFSINILYLLLHNGLNNF